MIRLRFKAKLLVFAVPASPLSLPRLFVESSEQALPASSSALTNAMFKPRMKWASLFLALRLLKPTVRFPKTPSVISRFRISAVRRPD